MRSKGRCRKAWVRLRGQLWEENTEKTLREHNTRDRKAVLESKIIRSLKKKSQNDFF